MRNEKNKRSLLLRNGLIVTTILLVIFGFTWNIIPVFSASRLGEDDADETDAVVYDVFGVEMQQTYPETGLTPIADAGISMVRYNGVKWSEVEANPGTYDWSKLAELENQLYYALNNGIDLVIVVRSAPSWAQKVNGYNCGPIAEINIKDFANFMNALVTRYKDYIKFWEIWNEPDAPLVQGQTEADGYSGCWGDPSDTTYYGGAYYSQMLDQVYDAIKAADPDAFVMVGGLMMSCGPNGNCSTNDKNILKFVDGILAERPNNKGLGRNFDIMTFHAYDYYTGGYGNYKNDAWGTNRLNTGPVTIAKANYLWNKLLYEYQIDGKWMVNSELALICDGSANPGGFCDSDPFEVTKSIYMGHAYSSAIATRLFRAFWYGARMGWRNTDILNLDYTPKEKINNEKAGPYPTLKFGRSELEGVIDGRQITEYGSGIQGYAFELPTKYVWVLWWTGSGGRGIQLPDEPIAVYDVDGDPQTLATQYTLRDTTEPFFIEFEKPTFLFVPLTVYKAPSFLNGNFDSYTDSVPDHWEFISCDDDDCENEGLDYALITLEDDSKKIFDDDDVPLGEATVQLGGTYTCNGGVPIGYASVKQTFIVPYVSDGLSINLEFKYIIYTNDNASNNNFDSLEVFIHNPDPNLEFWDGSTTTASCNSYKRVPQSGWKTGTIDLSDYIGETVTIEFRNSNKQDQYYNTVSYIDDVHFVYGP